jgi:ATP-dependent helicase/nuclease subunit B
MLTVSLLRNPLEKSHFLEQFSAHESTWVVSDLRNKFEIQQTILKSQEFYEDVSVLRASELWKLLLKRTFPDLKLVSGEMISTWVKEQLKKLSSQDGGMSLGANAHQVIVEMMDLMASVHSHPHGPTRIREWFQENPESLQRWGGWFLLSEQFFDELLSQKLLAARWAASYLQQQESWAAFWKRPLIFDLGSQLSQVEADLIQSLSRDLNVHVLVPHPEWKDDFQYLVKPYDFLVSQAQEKTASRPQPDDQVKSSKALRFSGVLAEAKMACQISRSWLEEQIPAEQIAIIAPDIEKYWPLLQPLLEAEGIPASKDVFSRLQSLPSMIQWLAEIRLAAQEVNYADLETAYFRSEHPKIRFEEFYSLFAEMISSEDLKRHDLILQSFQSTYDLNDEISRDQWMGFSASCWKSQADLEPIETCFKEILLNTEASLTMRVSSWIHLLEQIVARKEIRLQKGPQFGIQLSNLSAADSLQITHRIFLGLTESMLKNQTSGILSPREVLSISNELGFSLEHPEVSLGEFDLSWLSENPSAQNFYFYPQTGFAGGAEAPSSLWLKLADEDSQLISRPKEIRWDYVLQAEPFAWDPNEKQTVQLKAPISLSPSSIETYRKCPFIFAAQKIYRLVDLPVMDFDIDRRTRGLLAHAMLDQICAEPRRFDWSDLELRELIETLKPDLGLASMDQFIWTGLKEKHIQIARRFLKFESEWQSRFPDTQILAREKEFEFFWDTEKQTVAKAGHWKIRGRIDRVDHDQKGNLVLIDYKMTLGDYKNHAKWIEKNQLQLALYILALEEGAIEGFEAHDVVGAFYFVLKNMNRDKGLKVEEAAGALFDLDRKGNRIKEAQKIELLESLKKVIHDVIHQIQSGQFSPEPLEPDKCGECTWKNLCRAPHLN